MYILFILLILIIIKYIIKYYSITVNKCLRHCVPLLKADANTYGFCFLLIC